MTGFLLVAGVALVLCAVVLVLWWRAARSGSELVGRSATGSLADNPNRTKAMNARQGISIDGREWPDP